MISQTTEYALRAVVWLAGQGDHSASTSAIAQATQVPSHYLSKVLQGLSRAGLVYSRPGRTGGVRLARDPATMTVLEVVEAVDPIRRIHECPLGIHGTNLCPLHRRLDDAMAATEDAFAVSTISELLPDDVLVPPLCVPSSRTKRSG